jgi:bifunctional UDP-N-acetylglucosamine pyrophosphorylase/glucosamine-1-phosphate N-acetyltransferase
MRINIVILAAGQGKRMASRLPKVLQPLAGRPLLSHVVESARSLDPLRLVAVVGHGHEAVKAALADEPVIWVFQEKQLGTAHAVETALPHLGSTLPTLVLYGDVPLVRPETLDRLASLPEGLAILTARLPDPTGYGRILRDAAGNICGIAEEKDASPEERAICEVNTGIMRLPTARLADWFSRLSNANAQGEFYLTDVVALAAADGVPVLSVEAQPEEIEGANDRGQLIALERRYQAREAQKLLSQGVHLMDPARIDVRGHLFCGRDVAIDVGCIFEGTVSLSDGAKVGPYCVIKDALIGTDCEIAAFTHIDGAKLGDRAKVGPYARLRPGAALADEAHVGNFVEIKNSNIGKGSKANHLSYIGDADVGAGVNIGAGTITCNYDGKNKHRTTIGDGAFIGSGTQLVAPVNVG